MPRTTKQQSRPATDPPGYYLGAVLDSLRRGEPRSTPSRELAKLLAQPLSDDLAAFLRAVAGHRQKQFALGDYWLSEDTLEIRDPAVLQGHVCIGEAPNGDVWLAARDGVKPPQVFVALHETGWELEKADCGPGLEAFFAWLYEREQEESGDDAETDIDDYVRKNPPPPKVDDAGPFGLALVKQQRRPKKPEANAATKQLINGTNTYFDVSSSGTVLARFDDDQGTHFSALEPKRKRRVDPVPPFTGKRVWGSIHPDGTRAVLDVDGTLYLFSTTTGECRRIRKLPARTTLNGIEFLNDLICISMFKGRIEIMSVAGAEAEVVATFTPPADRDVGMVRGIAGCAVMLTSEPQGPDLPYRHYLIASQGDEIRLVHRYEFPKYGEQLSSGWTARGRTFVKSWHDTYYELEGLEKAVEQTLAAAGARAWSFE